MNDCIRRLGVFLSFAVLVLIAPHAAAQVSLTTLGTPYTQDFNTLPASGSATWTNNSTIPGWFHARTGTGTTIVANNGSSNAGNLYSYGTGTAAERALGSVGSGNAAVGNLFCGVRLQNNTGTTITQLDVSYTGEQWRNSAAAAQTVAFSYVNGSPAVTGSLAEFQSAGVAVPSLNFTSPITGGAAGLLDGNAAANRTAIAFSIAGLSIPNGAEVMLRWSDPDHTGADHGLAIDDFSVTPQGTSTPTLSVSDVTLAEGDPAGTTTFTFQVTLTAAAGPGGVTFDIDTADGTAEDDNPSTEDNDYVAQSLTGQVIPAGNSSYAFNVSVNRDTNVEPNETFFVNVSNITGANAGDVQGQGTITNDDIAYTAIHDIQGNGNTSPLSGSSVNVRGVVTGIKSGSSGGFFVQEADADADADPNTSEGIFVFTGASVPAGVAIGNRVGVSGTVTEFPSSAAPHTVTELSGTIGVSLLAAAQPLPAAIVLSPAEGTPSANVSHWERYEGMRVSATLTATSGTDGSVSEPNATATSNGVFFGILPGNPRPFREAGIPLTDSIPSEAPCAACIPRFDTNPEKFRVDSDGQPGAAQLNVAAGQTVANLVGPLDFGFFQYTILPEAATVPTVAGPSTYTAAPAPLSTELTVSSFNLERFFDTINDPGVSDPVLTPAAYANRLNKASLAIRNALNSPDVVGVVELENLATLNDLATKVNLDSAGAVNYAAYLVEGNDVGGIDVGFLVNTLRVTVTSVTQEGASATFVNPDTLANELLNDRPPLVLEGFITRTDATLYEFTVVVNHLRSLIGVETDDAAGRRVRAKRAAQAEFLANLVQARQSADPNERIILVGDFNAFEVSDGLVDVIGTIKGTPAPSNMVVTSSPDLVTPDLTALVETLPADARYSYNFDGNAQTIDHAIVNSAMMASLSRFAYAHVDADFPETFRNDATRPERISDHDAPVAYFDISPLPRLSIGDASLPEGNSGSSTMTFTVTLSDPHALPVTVQYTTSDNGSAVAGSDYVAESGLLTFFPGDQSEDITIDILGDTGFEADETFLVTLSNPSINAMINDGQATGTIVNDDPAIADLDLTMSVSPAMIGKGDPATFTLVVTNNGPQGATNVVVTDDLPSDITLVSTSTTQGSCTTVDPVVCSVGTLANGSSATITINVIMPKKFDDLTNTATATADQVDPTPASASVTIDCTKKAKDPKPCRQVGLE